MTKQRLVKFRGKMVIEGWPERLAKAQQQTTYSIDGKTLPRIRYGDESDDWHADEGACHDCSAIKGELHVAGCDAEECPSCHGQAFSCACDRDEEDGEE